MNALKFKASYACKKKWVNAALYRLLGKKTPYTANLYEAMHYALRVGGKRVRPVLSLMVDDFLKETFDQKPSKDSLSLAVSLELIHTYSLIHDDLPAMDDDDLRRGMPSCHKKFNEATAILAGDALLIKAFEMLATMQSSQTKEIIHLITKSCGLNGMAGGQQLDLDLEGQNIPQSTLKRLHSMKTGHFIEASVMSQTLMHQAFDLQQALKKYAKALGLLFQVTDDILDVTQPSETLGKNALSDIKNQKNTYVHLLGLEGARSHANTLANKAINAIHPRKLRPSSQNDYLVAFVKHILTRTF